MMLTLANYNSENRNFLGRMEQQYSVTKTLDTLAKDIAYSQGRGKEKIDSIKVYENRVIKLQKLVRDGPNTTHDADKEVDNILRTAFTKDLKQSFATCNKCNERFVKVRRDVYVANIAVSPFSLKAHTLTYTLSCSICSSSTHSTAMVTRPGAVQQQPAALRRRRRKRRRWALANVFAR